MGQRRTREVQRPGPARPQPAGYGESPSPVLVGFSAVWAHGRARSQGEGVFRQSAVALAAGGRGGALLLSRPFPVGGWGLGGFSWQGARWFIVTRECPQFGTEHTQGEVCGSGSGTGLVLVQNCQSICRQGLRGSGRRSYWRRPPEGTPARGFSWPWRPRALSCGCALVLSVPSRFWQIRGLGFGCGALYSSGISLDSPSVRRTKQHVFRVGRLEGTRTVLTGQSLPQSWATLPGKPESLVLAGAVRLRPVGCSWQRAGNRLPVQRVGAESRTVSCPARSRPSAVPGRGVRAQCRSWCCGGEELSLSSVPPEPARPRRPAPAGCSPVGLTGLAVTSPARREASLQVGLPPGPGRPCVEVTARGFPGKRPERWPLVLGPAGTRTRPFRRRGALAAAQ